MQVLPPGVKHGEEADGSPQQPRVSRGFQQRGGGGTEQDVIDLSCVLKRQAPDLLRQREDHVEIGDWQKLGFTLRQPASTGLGLALGTVPVAAGVI